MSRRPRPIDLDDYDADAPLFAGWMIWALGVALAALAYSTTVTV